MLWVEKSKNFFISYHNYFLPTIRVPSVTILSHLFPPFSTVLIWELPQNEQLSWASVALHFGRQLFYGWTTLQHSEAQASSAATFGKTNNGRKITHQPETKRKEDIPEKSDSQLIFEECSPVSKQEKRENANGLAVKMWRNASNTQVWALNRAMAAESKQTLIKEIIHLVPPHIFFLLSVASWIIPKYGTHFWTIL